MTATGFLMVRVAGAAFDEKAPCTSCGHGYGGHFLRNDASSGGCDAIGVYQHEDGRIEATSPFNVRVTCACDGFTARLHLVSDGVVSSVQEQG